MKHLTNPTFWLVVEAILLGLFWPTVMIIATVVANSEKDESSTKPVPVQEQVQQAATGGVRR